MRITLTAQLPRSCDALYTGLPEAARGGILELLNRCVVTVTAKELFLHWLQSILREDATTLNEVNLDASAYLLPDYPVSYTHLTLPTN